MSPRTMPPFRADHVGSFLRPERLHEARKQRADGVISAGQLRAVEDEAVREVVALQREAGLRSVTDGEFRRASWHMDFVYQIGGISKVPGSLVSTPTAPAGRPPSRPGRAGCAGSARCSGPRTSPRSSWLR